VADRKAFPLRLSQDLYDELRRWAEQEFRSVNGQIEFLLQEAVRQRRRRPRRAQSPDKTA
jgi:hypothetical protein